MADLRVTNGPPIKADQIVKLRSGEFPAALLAATDNGEENVFFQQGADTFVASQRWHGGPSASGARLAEGTKLELNGEPAKVVAIKGPPAGRKVADFAIAFTGLAGAVVGVCGALAGLAYLGSPVGLALFLGFVAMTAIGAYATTKSADIAAALHAGGKERPELMKAFGEVVS